MELEDIDFRVDIWTPLHETEDTQRVLSCLGNIFPQADWEIGEDEISGISENLERFADILQEMRIRDTARSFMLGRIIEDECSFTLSKQATCNSKVNFATEEQPLGGIEVTITSEDIEELLRNITETGEEG